METVKRFFGNTMVQSLILIITLMLVLFGFYKEGAKAGALEWKGKYETLLATEEERQKQWVARAKADSERLLLEQKEISAALSEKVTELENRELPVQVVIREVPKYVTQKADSECTVTAGFKWVYDSSLLLPSAADLARDRPSDVDAPTGITLSGVAGVAGENNSECAVRGELLRQWQAWYLQNQKSFERMGLAAAP